MASRIGPAEAWARAWECMWGVGWRAGGQLGLGQQAGWPSLAAGVSRTTGGDEIPRAAGVVLARRAESCAARCEQFKVNFSSEPCAPPLSGPTRLARASTGRGRRPAGAPRCGPRPLVSGHTSPGAMSNLYSLCSGSHQNNARGPPVRGRLE